MRSKQFRLWKDVPESERVDREFLLRCGGASPETWTARFPENNKLSPEEMATRWITRAMKRLTQDNGCAVALKWSWGNKWKKCSTRVAPGYAFCYRHGGPKPQKRILQPLPKKSDDPQWVLMRLEIRYARLRDRRNKLEALMATVLAQIKALQIKAEKASVSND